MDFTGVKSFFKLTIVSSKGFILFEYGNVSHAARNIKNPNDNLPWTTYLQAISKMHLALNNCFKSLLKMLTYCRYAALLRLSRHSRLLRRRRIGFCLVCERNLLFLRSLVVLLPIPRQIFNENYPAEPKTFGEKLS
jgi:hypothetical protein